MEQANTGAIERKALIFNVQKYNMYDGPGVRTNVFFKGCPLRCKWCANPEGLERKMQVMFKKSACIDCGACVAACPEGIHVSPGTPGNTWFCGIRPVWAAANAWPSAPRMPWRSPGK